jgi:hypothetical protein
MLKEGQNHRQQNAKASNTNSYVVNVSLKKIQQDTTVYQNVIIYMELNVFRATHRPSSGA